jgi:hypothetical protein
VHRGQGDRRGPYRLRCWPEQGVDLPVVVVESFVVELDTAVGRSVLKDRVTAMSALRNKT